MFQKSVSLSKAVLCLYIFAPMSLYASQIDKTRYITIDEIKPGMDATCLTVYKGMEIEKFNLKVVDVVRNIAPNRDAILVMGTDERFIHTGPVAGCSGSPVYINGRLAGALAFGWTFSKDPLYGVTPIAEMLRAGDPSPVASASLAPVLDFSKPLDLKTAYRQTNTVAKPLPQAQGVSKLLCPIATTLPADSFSGLTEVFESIGFLPVSGGASGKLSKYTDVSMKPGGALALPLVYGDIELSAIGTITEVVDNKIYGFGHSFTGEGTIDVPMATGYVNTVVASVVRSFKFGQPIEVKGALYADSSTAVVGEIGKKAVTIPMHIKVERFDDKARIYNCQMASHKFFTPLLTEICLAGTARMLGALPAEHSVWYKTRIGIQGREPICFENFSSSNDIGDYLSDSVAALGLVMNNPYDRPPITSLDFEVKILPKTEISHIWSFDISAATIKPGQTITAKITIESFLSGHKTYTAQIKIPNDIQPGEYEIMASGISDYDQLRKRLTPYRYVPENLPDLIKIINDIANTKRNNLYVTMVLPPSGIVLEKAELPQLPVTKALLLKNEKRAAPAMPAMQWLQETIPVNTIVLDSANLTITVEKKD